MLEAAQLLSDPATRGSSKTWGRLQVLRSDVAAGQLTADRRSLKTCFYANTSSGWLRSVMGTN